MKLVVLTHPSFFVSSSMPRFAEFIVSGMRERGHIVEVWTARPITVRLPVPSSVKKWLGYFDQFVLFPVEAAWRRRRLSGDTLFVFADQALGPWIRLAQGRPRVVHCHDFAALRAIAGEFDGIHVALTGRIYQSWIKSGFVKADSFISVSERTKSDLEKILPKKPVRSTVVYNGLNFPFERMPAEEARNVLAARMSKVPREGFLLHVGGNQWHKNRIGLLRIYAAYAALAADPLPLWLVGAQPTDQLRKAAQSISRGSVVFATGLSNREVQACYSLSDALVFPSVAEGFGWPLAEAMACGCPIITTDDAPMTEIASDVAWYIPVVASSDAAAAQIAAQTVVEVLRAPEAERTRRRELGYALCRRYSRENALDGYERVYGEIVRAHAEPYTVSSRSQDVSVWR